MSELAVEAVTERLDQGRTTTETSSCAQPLVMDRAACHEWDELLTAHVVLGGVNAGRRLRHCMGERARPGERAGPFRRQRSERASTLRSSDGGDPLNPRC